MLLAEYRRVFPCLDYLACLYVRCYELGLDLLVTAGRLCLICTNRWIKNRYGGPLLAKISEQFHLSHFIDMEGVDAFHTEVIAYPAITIIARSDAGTAGPSRVVGADAIDRSGLASGVSALRHDSSVGNTGPVDLSNGSVLLFVEHLPS